MTQHTKPLDLLHSTAYEKKHRTMHYHASYTLKLFFLLMIN